MILLSPEFLFSDDNSQLTYSASKKKRHEKAHTTESASFSMYMHVKRPFLYHYLQQSMQTEASPCQLVGKEIPHSIRNDQKYTATSLSPSLFLLGKEEK